MSDLIVKIVLEDQEFDQIFDIRRTVFGEEQNVPDELEFDGHDHISHHLLALYKGVPCGTARWRITFGGNLKLERFCVLKEYRGKGVGGALVQAMMEVMPKNIYTYLNAQKEVIPFYEKFGFIAEGEEFTEAAIVHRKMVLPNT